MIMNRSKSKCVYTNASDAIRFTTFRYRMSDALIVEAGRSKTFPSQDRSGESADLAQRARVK